MKYIVYCLNKCSLLLIVIAAFFVNVANAGTILQTGSSYPVQYPLLLKDFTGRLTINEILQKKMAFTPSHQPVVSLDVTRAAVWLNFTITNKSYNAAWYIEISTPPLLHDIEVYVQEAENHFRLLKMYGDEKYQERFVKVNNPVIPVTLPVNSSTVFYVKVTSRNFLRVPLRVATMQTLYESNHGRDLANGIVFGMLMAFMIYNLFVFLSLREVTYLYYVGYVLSWGLNLVHYNGYLPDFLRESSWVSDSGIFIPLSALSSVGFTNSFLQTHKFAPFISKTKWILVALCLVPVILSLCNYQLYSFMYIQLLVYPTFTYWFIAGFTSYRNGYKPALYYIAGFGTYMIGSGIYNLKDHNLLPENLFTATSMHWGAALEAIVLSFALANKLNFYKKEKEKIQNHALEQTKAFSKQLLQAQESERKRIASELHDSVGQKLILIKNKSLLLRKGNEAQKDRLIGISEDIAETIQEIRNIAYYLRPYQMDLFGITQAIMGLLNETAEAVSIKTTTDVDQIDGLFSKENEMNIYRIIQELLNNMIKHAEATECIFRIAKTAGHVCISIADNGKGFDPDAVKRGAGLLGIKERVNILSGELRIQNASPNGTIITINLPIVNDVSC
jgi:signal transduction histidine kinase